MTLPICTTQVHIEHEGRNDVQLFYVDHGDLIESAALQFCAKHNLADTECRRIQSYHQEQCVDTVMQQQEIGNPNQLYPYSKPT